ncbi:MAG: hypothetical protein SP1CHLAM54_10110 [Chlamydiia bacterium]|nr:hypothetical protein [Chlamydiia bacterium]MCH9615917.1 hypothetical protein [Chlamydiia bacterium]MCH9628680.1 hypothetical protein [Chlamydiia bacterium]
MKIFLFLILPLVVFGMQSNEVLDFWFGPLDDEGRWDPAKAERWFNGGEKIDEEISEKFSKAIDLIHQDWLEDPEGRLAHIILYDQFSRNIHRGSSKAFSYDEKALVLALDGIGQGDDIMLQPIERMFFYLPLEHAEDLELQELSVSMFQQLLEDAPEDQKPFFEGTLDYALRHHHVIEKFGRFPHRNPALSRETTPEEKEYLEACPSGF